MPAGAYSHHTDLIRQQVPAFCIRSYDPDPTLRILQRRNLSFQQIFLVRQAIDQHKNIYSMSIEPSCKLESIINMRQSLIATTGAYHNSCPLVLFFRNEERIQSRSTDSPYS